MNDTVNRQQQHYPWAGASWLGKYGIDDAGLPWATPSGHARDRMLVAALSEIQRLHDEIAQLKGAKA